MAEFDFKKLKADGKAKVTVDHQAHETMVAAVFEKAGVARQDARATAQTLVLADLRGMDTHGTWNLVKGYTGGLMKGDINPRPKFKVVHETPSTATVDGDKGLGILAGRFAMGLAIEKAAKVGTGSVAVLNSKHFAMCQAYPIMALGHDMIGMAVTSNGIAMVPTFARDAWTGTNPIAFAAPADKEPPFVLDMATTVTAAGKLGIAKQWGVDVPRDWLAPPEEGAKELQPGLMRQPPLGFTREMSSHKGWGLAVMVDILAGVLSANGVPGMLPPGAPSAHYFQAMRVDGFRPAADFKRHMDEMLRAVRNLAPAKGHDRVLYAGLLEWESEQKRRKEGIPLPPWTVDYFRSACAELGVKCAF